MLLSEWQIKVQSTAKKLDQKIKNRSKVRLIWLKVKITYQS